MTLNILEDHNRRDVSYGRVYHDVMIAPENLLCLFEGNDDYLFYYNKIRNLADNKNLTTRKVRCYGKNNVLRAISEIKINKKILGFIDKDFDDFLEITQPNCSNLFITDGYSFENYLVNQAIFERFLEDITTKQSFDKNELKEKFKQAYYDFVDIMRPMMEKSANFLQERSDKKFPYPEEKDEFKCFFKIDANYICKTGRKKINHFGIATTNNKISFINQDSKLWLRGKYAFTFMQVFCQKIEDNLQASKKSTNCRDAFMEYLSNKINFSDQLNNFLNKHI